MTWTYQQLQTEIQNEVDDDTSDGLTVIKQFINDICREVWHSRDWSFKNATSYIDSIADQSEYDLVTLIPTCSKINTVGYKGENQTEFIPVRETDIQRYNSVLIDRDSSGTPMFWIYLNGTLYLWLKPDYTGTDNIEINHDVIFNELSANGDVPQIPEKYRAVIKAGVKMMYWNYDDDVRADAEEKRYFLGQRNMVLEDNGSLGGHEMRLLR